MTLNDIFEGWKRVEVDNSDRVMKRVKVKEIDYPGGYTEIIVCDDVVNKRNNKNGGRKKGKKKTEVENLKRKVYRVKRDIKRLALKNRLYRMMTLTFRENILSANVADRYFADFIYRLRNEGFNLKYISVKERQERGAVHYHVLIDMFIPQRQAYRIWNEVVSGGVHFKAVGIKGIFYLVKYIEKNLEENIFVTEKGFAKKCYSVSEGLDRNLDDITREYYCYVVEVAGKVKEVLSYEYNRILNDIDKAEVRGQLVYLNEGRYGPDDCMCYRCCLIAPLWDKSFLDN